MSPEALARELGIDAICLRRWLRREYPRPTGRKGAPWTLTMEMVEAARANPWRGVRPSGSVVSEGDAAPGRAKPAREPQTANRANSDESYVVDICDDVLGEKAIRQHRFSWLVGDRSALGRSARLPVDAYYEGRRLVVEYRERQHYEAVPFFDRRETVSGMGRGEQRSLYDLRREEEIPKHGLRLRIIRVGQLSADGRGRLRRDERHDRAVIESVLQDLLEE